ncbi:hypothetical protein LTR04_001437, partial [Oleoguttula sp. CCFEE 6159]
MLSRERLILISQLLGIDKQASEREIKKAYRTLSKKYHPDKNPYVTTSPSISKSSISSTTANSQPYRRLVPDPLTNIFYSSSDDESAKQKFVEIAEAYDALSTPETRKIYDQYGHEGLKQRQQGGDRQQHHDPFDLFSRFFGGGGHFGHGERRGPNMEVRVHVPLRDFYNGAEHDFTIERQGICGKCEGTGSEDGVVDVCQTCGGRGMVVQKHMLAPGIFQQMQMQCDKCGGKGKTVRHACKVCGGTRVIRETESHVLHVEKGMPKGVRITYENEADESPDWVAGDLIVLLMELEPSLGATDENLERTDGTFFRRKGKDLFWRE